MQPAQGRVEGMNVMVDDLQVSVLGTVGIRAAGVDVELGVRLQRLLGALTIANGAAVSVDQLIEIVWAGEPPPSAETTLRSYVTRLRHALSADRGLVSRGRPAT
jgi:DNA-binding SARP family transcriptional activator